jgi:hypothetical protein
MDLDAVIQSLPDPGPLVHNQHTVASLQKALISTPQNLTVLRGTLRRVLSNGAWLDRVDPERGARFRYGPEDFLAFIKDPLPKGLSTDVDTIRKFIADDSALVVAFELAIDKGRGGNNNPAGKGGRARKNDNRDIVTVDKPAAQPPRGNSPGYAARRLSRERPDLLEKVKAGELSAHRAMIEAGFRREKTPLEWLRHWWDKASAAEQQDFKDFQQQVDTKRSKKR